MTKDQIAKILGRRRMAMVGEISFEGRDFQIILKDGLINTRWETDARFFDTTETMADLKADMLEFFDDIELV